MPPTLGDRLFHILEAIENIQSILLDRSIADVSNSLHTRLALERLFEIVCEASRDVPNDIKAREADIDWQHMTDLGNLLRHAYHRVDVSRLMQIAQNDLPTLKAFVQKTVDEETKR